MQPRFAANRYCGGARGGILCRFLIRGACGSGWAGGAGVRPLVRADCYLCRLFGPAYVTTAVHLANTEERSTERRNEGGLSPDIVDPSPMGDTGSSGINLGLTEESDVSDENLSDAPEITVEKNRDVDTSTNRSNFLKQFRLGQNKGRIFNPGAGDEDREAEEEEPCSEGTKKEKKLP
ncbi:hypothetical protein NDU88_007016 [Pleurodeles waltl]|uniref:Uncharacterized protein n=1 Tax=Pleurodeles waltl TaxID=8319 RepID=A0AAV7QJE7_PLEWA|nr:hypothetical protein NDU88_007016 [Pleurodeles waltl]